MEDDTGEEVLAVMMDMDMFGQLMGMLRGLWNNMFPGMPMMM
ncbi:hypothetical protein [Nocardia sp. NPDC050793]